MFLPIKSEQAAITIFKWMQALYPCTCFTSRVLERTPVVPWFGTTMSSDGYFDDDDDDINVSLLNELDAIEAAHFSPPKNNQSSTSTARAPPLTRASSGSDFFDDSTFDLNEAELQRLDTFIEDSYQITITMGCAVLPHLWNSVNCIAHGLSDKQ